MNLLVIILNYRTPQITLDCLASLSDKQAEIPSGFQAIVVENGSGDGSAAELAEAIGARGWGDWVKLFALPKNLGFAGGNNFALKMLKDEYRDVPYTLLLNSDTIVHTGALRHCYDLMQSQPDIGLASCQLLNLDQSLQISPRDFPSPLKQAICAFGLPWTWPKRFAWADIYEVTDEKLCEKRDVDWLLGAFHFVRATALAQVGGGLDDSFFFYGEDIEFCFRFRKHGWRVHYDPATAITHIGGSSSDPTRISSKMKNAHFWRARYHVQRKCYGTAAAWMIRGCDVTAIVLRKTKMWLNGKRSSQPAHYQNLTDALHLLLRPLST